ncbi:MAG: GHKL domain-containing protein [Raoultibacter sp.]
MNTWLLFEIAINLYQAALMTYFVRQRFHLVRRSLWSGVLCAIAIWIYLTAYLFIDMPFLDTSVIVFPILYTFYISDDEWYIKLFWNAVLALILSGVVSLIMNLYMQLTDATMAQMMSETPLRVSFVVSCNIALLLVIFVATRLGKKRMDALSWVALIVFLGMLVMELAVIELLYTIRVHVQIDDVSFTAASLCMMGCAVLSLLLYEIMSASAAKQKNIEAELETAKLSQQHYEEIKDMYGYMVSHEHEMKHQFGLIHKLLEDGHMREGEALFKEQSLPQAIRYEFITGNTAADALLTVKKLMMDRYNICFKYQSYPLTELPIAESKFCAILSNILDNAIEAIVRMDDRSNEHTIELRLARSWNFFFFTCENDMNPRSIHMSGSHFLSSKKESTRHGYGTKNVKSIVNEANGQCKFIVKDSTFRIEITLPYEEGNEHEA